MTVQPVHGEPIPAFASIKDLIAQTPVEPVYALYPEKFRVAARRFLDSFPGDALYAVKANPAPQVLDQVWAAGIRHFDTASLREVELIKGRFPEAICHFMAPVRLPGAARTAFHRYGVTDYVVDCDFELEKLLAEVGDAGRLRIFVRIATPLGGAVLELSSKFGTSPQEAARLLRRVADAGARPALTFHVGSQCLSPFSYAQAIEMARRTATLAGVRIEALDIGGGFPGPYSNNDVPPYHWYFDTIREALDTLPHPVPILCEPGRALAAEGVSLVTQVILRKGDTIYINDGTYGSFDELTLPGWSADYPVRTFSVDAAGRVRTRDAAGTAFRVYGPTCDTLDVLPRPITLPQTIKAGDFIVFDNIGAYSVAVRTGFNGFFPDRWAVVGV
ncbi:MAG: type III PLP-dependent enzyme [Alphaproteobacteria bacterium]|nr:type III PLP-dependent enzyme [Alphaproteobacteria bacterium]